MEAPRRRSRRICTLSVSAVAFCACLVYNYCKWLAISYRPQVKITGGRTCGRDNVLSLLDSKSNYVVKEIPCRSLFCRYCCVLLNVAVAVSCASSYRRMGAFQARVKSALRNVLPPPRIGRALLLMSLFCLLLQKRKDHLPNQSCVERWKHIRIKVILCYVEYHKFFSVAAKCVLKYSFDQFCTR